MKLSITESQLKKIINELSDEYKQSSIRGRTINKIHTNLNPDKEVSVGSGSGKGFTSKYEKSEAKRKSLIDKEKEKQENAFKNSKIYLYNYDRADSIRQDIINRRKKLDN
jgi:ribosomal protein S4